MMRNLKENLIFHYESAIYLMVALLGLKIICSFATWGEEFYMPFQGFIDGDHGEHVWFIRLLYAAWLIKIMFLVTIFRVFKCPENIIDAQPEETRNDSSIAILVSWFIMMVIIVFHWFAGLDAWDPYGDQRQGGRIKLRQ